MLKRRRPTSDVNDSVIDLSMDDDAPIRGALSPRKHRRCASPIDLTGDNDSTPSTTPSQCEVKYILTYGFTRVCAEP